MSTVTLSSAINAAVGEFCDTKQSLRMNMAVELAGIITKHVEPLLEDKWDELAVACGYSPLSVESRAEFVKMVKHTITQATANLERNQALERARPLEEWDHEDGNVLWWKFPVEEPPYCGTPNDTAWPGYHTHWTPVVEPGRPPMACVCGDYSKPGIVHRSDGPCYHETVMINGVIVSQTPAVVERIFNLVKTFGKSLSGRHLTVAELRTLYKETYSEPLPTLDEADCAKLQALAERQ